MRVYTHTHTHLMVSLSLFVTHTHTHTLIIVNSDSLRVFQVVDLQVFASPRITLKPLVPSFPCFAKILVSLMEKVRCIVQ